MTDRSMDFEWDAEKDKANLKKHGVAFGEAIVVFGDPSVVVIDVTRSKDGESRSKAIGRIDGRLFVTIFTMRGSVKRIISARRANRKEERTYGGKSEA